VLIPILVLLSGLFAGLTLGYMSLDETQLNVLSISGTAYGFSIFFFENVEANERICRVMLVVQPTTRIRQQDQAHPFERALIACHTSPGEHGRQ
jgi:hypothetical protein